MVEKHHVIRFVAERRVSLLLHPSGEQYVHVIDRAAGQPPPALPTGWQLEEIALAEDWVVRLPTPTTVFFFPNGDSFQGPLAELPG